MLSRIRVGIVESELGVCPEAVSRNDRVIGVVNHVPQTGKTLPSADVGQLGGPDLAGRDSYPVW